MILADKTLKLLVEQGLIKSPLTKADLYIGPASIDLTLSNDIRVFNDRGETEHIKCTKEVVIKPKEFLLASTNEYVEIPNNMAGIVMGRSSIARLGVQVECAGFIDSGFKGKITLEVFNQTDLLRYLPVNGRVCQLVMFKLDQECENPYRGKYQGQETVTESRLEDYE